MGRLVPTPPEAQPKQDGRIHVAIQTALTDLGDLLNELRAAGMGI